jgi:hypothetical protein
MAACLLNWIQIEVHLNLRLQEFHWMLLNKPVNKSCSVFVIHVQKSDYINFFPIQANSKHSPGLAKRIQNNTNNDDNQENNLDFHLEKNLKNLNLSATTPPNNNSNQTKTRKMREMTPDSIDDDSQPNSITTSLNENIQGYGVFTSPTQSLSNMSQNPMSMPVKSV